MSTEIECKFLVFKEKLPVLKGGQHFVQGYLQREPQIRFRLIGDRAVLTIKTLKPDGSRFEFEAEKSFASAEERRALCELAIVPPIEKTRYSVPCDSLIWEIDVYAGENAGLITVDVELPRLDYPLRFPEWVNAQAEITRNPRYFNYNLAQRPFKRWQKD